MQLCKQIRQFNVLMNILNASEWLKGAYLNKSQKRAFMPGWLPKTRQVGKSGVTVKPKIYIAIGISGAPEHIQGMKDAATIIDAATAVTLLELI